MQLVLLTILFIYLLFFQAHASVNIGIKTVFSLNFFFAEICKHPVTAEEYSKLNKNYFFWKDFIPLVTFTEFWTT